MRKLFFFTLFVLEIISLPIHAQAFTNASANAGAEVGTASSHSREARFYFNNLGVQKRTFSLRRLKPDEQIEFNIRHDELVSKGTLHLQFTPSPSLIPIESQIKVYLNDELIQVIAINKEQLGKSNVIDVPIDPHYINNFNRLRLEFIEHYQASCENQANTTLWIDISQASYLKLTLQALDLQNDLSYFPEPFFDALDNQPLTLPIVFAGQPDLLQQRAAAVLASWFGSKTLWRGQSFPVLFNQLPNRNGIVFATNNQKPDFLKNHPEVHAPTVELINHPDHPYIKLLLILGRDGNDLIQAVNGIAGGSVLFRGQSITVNEVTTVAPRKPYDAPNWVRSDRPTPFAELQQYAEQLQSSGLTPYPITLSFNLPPDLFLNHSRGINVQLKYRYTPAPVVGNSHLNIALNNFFIQSFQLEPPVTKDTSALNFFLLNTAPETKQQLHIPVIDLGTNNQISFDFDYALAIGGGNTNGQCETHTFVTNYAAIDSTSTIDFSNYLHYLEMPNLSAFSSAGFPFSRMADLSQTWVLINKPSQPIEVSTLLNTMGHIGAQTGYPALEMTLTDDWSKVQGQDRDILIIGTVPPDLREDNKINLLINKTLSWIKEPFRQYPLPNLPALEENTAINSKTNISSQASMSAIIGMQSPFYKQRSIVALLADSPKGFELLNETLTNKEKLAKVFGTASVIRNSGITSKQVGPTYYVGHLSWWLHIWFSLQKHPINMALLSLLLGIVIAFLLWRGLTTISRRRI